MGNKPKEWKETTWHLRIQKAFQKLETKKTPFFSKHKEPEKCGRGDHFWIVVETGKFIWWQKKINTSYLEKATGLNRVL